jgi:CheY-like chemotaxis protein
LGLVANSWERKLKILIIDDEPLVRRVLSRVFKGRGHEVFEAFEGGAGLLKWRKNFPDLVFLDVLMPGLSGPEVLKEICLENRAKVILMSAYSGEHNIDTAQQMGAHLFVAKPFENIFKLAEQAEELVENG